MTETPKPTRQSGEPVIFKKEDGNYRVSQITGEITEPLLIQDDIADLEAAKRVAKEVLTGGQTWYHDYRDPPFRLRNSHEICSRNICAEPSNGNREDYFVLQWSRLMRRR